MKSERNELDKRELIDLIIDSLHLIALHYGIWFGETERQLGLDKAIEVDDAVWSRVLPVMLDRVARRFNLPVKNGIPEFLTSAGKEELVGFLADMGKNWLASDGIWFQTIEKDSGISTAKKINDSCWSGFPT